MYPYRWYFWIARAFIDILLYGIVLLLKNQLHMLNVIKISECEENIWRLLTEYALH